MNWAIGVTIAPASVQQPMITTSIHGRWRRTTWPSSCAITARTCSRGMHSSRQSESITQRSPGIAPITAALAISPSVGQTQISRTPTPAPLASSSRSSRIGPGASRRSPSNGGTSNGTITNNSTVPARAPVNRAGSARSGSNRSARARNASLITMGTSSGASIGTSPARACISTKAPREGIGCSGAIPSSARIKDDSRRRFSTLHVVA